MTRCHTVWTLARPTIHRITRRVIRHVAHHKLAAAALIATTVCVGAPVAIIAALPPTIARPVDFMRPVAPTPVPEPGVLVLMAPALGGLVLARAMR